MCAIIPCSCTSFASCMHWREMCCSDARVFWFLTQGNLTPPLAPTGPHELSGTADTAYRSPVPLVQRLHPLPSATLAQHAIRTGRPRLDRSRRHDPPGIPHTARPAPHDVLRPQPRGQGPLTSPPPPPPPRAPLTVDPKSPEILRPFPERNAPPDLRAAGQHLPRRSVARARSPSLPSTR